MASFASTLGQPANPAAFLGQGFQAGAGVAEARARMALQQRIANQAAEREQYQVLLDENKEALRRAQFDAELGLKQQEQQLAAEKQQIVGQEIAQRIGAMQSYRTRVGAGEDPAKVLMELGPVMGGESSALAAIFRQAGQPERPQSPSTVMGIPIIDPETGVSVPGLIGAPTSGGGVSVHPKPGYAGELSGQRSATEHGKTRRIAVLNAKRKEIAERGLFKFPAPPKNPEMAKQWAEDRKSLVQIAQELQRIAPPIGGTETTSAQSFKPAPAIGQRAVGETYQTPKGLFTWSEDESGNKGWLPYTQSTSEEMGPTEEDDQSAPPSED